MREVMLVTIALAVAGARGPAPEPPANSSSTNCRNRITQVRAGLGQPKLDRGTASADEPLLIAAVEKRIDGCPVLVMRNDTTDLRPLPDVPDQPGVHPAR